MNTAEDVIDEIFQEWKSKFGREYQKLVGYQHEDADILLLTMGSMSGTARATVDKLREEGKKVGLIKMTVLRPFPVKELIELTANCKALAVIERDISPGFGGAVFSEVSAVYVNRDTHPKILNYIVGLGGRDITIPDFETVVDKVENVLSTGNIENATEWINTRTEDIE
jgi:pyruvate ferredoxin oxidoreductase alpha subunit